LTPKEFKIPDNSRTIRPVKASIQLCLNGPNPAIVQAEAIIIKAFNFAIGGDVVRQIGPFLVGTIPKSFHIRWPYIPATQFGNTDTKLLAIYDFGTDSKLGLRLCAKLWVEEGPNTPGASLHNLPIKEPILVKDDPLGSLDDLYAELSL